jgi:hypothetical protein
MTSQVLGGDVIMYCLVSTVAQLKLVVIDEYGTIME